MLVSIAIFGILIIGMLAAFSGALPPRSQAGRVDRASPPPPTRFQSISDAGYTSSLDSTPPSSPSPSAAKTSSTVDKITGTAVTDDGLVVEFVTFSQTSGD